MSSEEKETQSSTALARQEDISKNEPKEEMTKDSEADHKANKMQSLSITNPEGDKELESNPKRKQVNKELGTMSKNTKEKQKNRRLSKPSPKTRATGLWALPHGSLSKFLNMNPMYLLTLIGVVIAGINLWYQRKQVVDDKEEDRGHLDDTLPGGGESSFAGGSNLPPKNKSPRKRMDPFEWQRHHTQTGIFPNPGLFGFD